ncbi:MAG: asparagine synthase-related protein [Myxococcales bacterium]
MTALFGAYSPVGMALPEGLGAAMARALPRPVDAEGFMQQGPLLLGARARWWTESELGLVPPWCDPHSGVTGVFDGRLDHHEQLALDLGVSATLSDSALMVAAYLRWDDGFLRRLRGDFALALWDPRARKLLIARDGFGVRPLYWAQLASGTLLFASRASALFAHPELTQELDSLRIAQYLASSFTDLERTFFARVKRLPPGHLMVLHEGERQAQPHRYFAFDRERVLPSRDNGAYAEQFRALFFDAVRTRTRTREPLACLLSGGLDSSGLLGTLRAVLPEQAIPCFSARFVDFPEVDEGGWLALFDADGTRRGELRADRIGPLDSIDELHRDLDEPFHAPNLFVYEALARLAHAQGARVLLDGLDGDTVVDHGYFALRELLFQVRPRRLVAGIRALHHRMGFGYAEILRGFVLEPELRAVQHALSRVGWLPSGYLTRELARQSGLASELARHAEERLSDRSLRALHHRAVTAPMLPFYLEVYDKLAAVLGVEHRHPYFDTALVEFCLALPPEQRLFEGWDRVIQRRAFQGLIPEPIRARQTKSVWSANFERQLFWGRPERVRGLLESHESPLAAYCDLNRMRRDLPRLVAGRAPERVMDFWCALSLGLWLEGRHADAPQAPEA